MKTAIVLVLAFVCLAFGFFVDVTERAGLDHEQQPIPMEDCFYDRCVPMGMSGGAAAGDYNNDGWTDLLVTRIFKHDMLFRNNGDGTFTDVAENVGLEDSENHRSNGALWCDIDNDNDLDLFVTTIGNPELESKGNRFYLYINDDGEFHEDAKARGVALDDGAGRYGTSASCGDFNGDGWLDIHVNQWNGNKIGIEIPHTRLFQNTGNGRFMDVTSQHDFRDLDVVGEFNFASAFVDMDKDGDQDLLVSGDFKTSQYYRNDNGRYVDITDSSNCCGEDNGMGITFGDIDQNGYLDWYITSIGVPTNPAQTGNRLYNNAGTNVIVDVTDTADVRYASWGWGAQFLDWDNDSDLDLVCTNGQWTNLEVFYTDPTYAWENVEGDGKNMESVASAIGIVDTHVGKSAISIDYDNDGDLDLVISNTGPGVILYENTMNNNNDWLKVKAPGTVSNSYGIGAQITVIVNDGDRPLYRELGAGSHFLGHNELSIAHFGLGSGSSPVFSVEVYWPVSGSRVTRRNVDRNSVLIITEDGSASYGSNSSVNTNNDDDDSSSNSSSSSRSGSSSSSSSSASTLSLALGLFAIVALVI